VSIESINPSGGDDSPTIQAAIDRLATTTAYTQNVLVFEPGRYRLNSVLSTPIGKVPPALTCCGLAHFTYRGPLTDSYLLNYRGICYPQMRCLVGLHFDTYWKARGLLIENMRYGAVFDRLSILSSRQVEIDAIGCWGSSWTNIGISNARGIAFRGKGFNSVMADSWKIGQYSVDHVTISKRNELRQYIINNGVDAARTYYGTDLIEEWPDPSDTSVKDWNNNNVQTPISRRGAVVIDTTSGAGLKNWCMEGIYCYDNFLISLYDVNYGHIDGLRFEGVVGFDSLIRSEFGQANIFESIITSPTYNKVPYVVTLYGHCRENVLRSIYGNGVSAAIMRLTGESFHKQWGNAVEHAYVRDSWSNDPTVQVNWLQDDIGQLEV